MLKRLMISALALLLVGMLYPQPFAQDTQDAHLIFGYRVVEGGDATATLGGVIPAGISDSGALGRVHIITYCDVGQAEMAAVEPAMLFPVSSVFTVGFFGGGTFWLTDELGTVEEETIWRLMGSTGGFASAKLNPNGLGVWAGIKWLAPITEDHPDGQWMFGVGASLKL